MPEQLENRMVVNEQWDSFVPEEQRYYRRPRRERMLARYWTCENCGANLDFGESCDCEEGDNE